MFQQQLDVHYHVASEWEQILVSILEQDYQQVLRQIATQVRLPHEGEQMLATTLGMYHTFAQRYTVVALNIIYVDTQTELHREVIANVAVTLSEGYIEQVWEAYDKHFPSSEAATNHGTTSPEHHQAIPHE